MKRISLYSQESAGVYALYIHSPEETYSEGSHIYDVITVKLNCFYIYPDYIIATISNVDCQEQVPQL